MEFNTKYYVSVYLKIFLSNDIPWFSYNGPIILTIEVPTIFCYFPVKIIKTDQNYVNYIFRSSCMIFMFYMRFQ